MLTLLLAIIAGCESSERSAYSNIDPQGWRYGDTVYFTPACDGVPTDSVRTGDLSIVIRHNNSYEYSNIWLEIDYNSPDSTICDTINLRLADDFGNWLGRGIGVSYQQSYLALPDVSLDVTKPVKLTHIMRVDTLANIEQVGIVFVPTE